MEKKRNMKKQYNHPQEKGKVVWNEPSKFYSFTKLFESQYSFEEARMMLKKGLEMQERVIEFTKLTNSLLTKFLQR